MKTAIPLLVVGALLALGPQPAAAQRADREGCEDPAIVSRLDDFYITICWVRDFDSWKFGTPHGDTVIEGRLHFWEYHIQKGATQPSSQQVVRNYVNAIRAIDGEITAENKWNGSMKVTEGDQEVWLHVAGGSSSYRMWMVEKEAMEQDVVADAAALHAGIERTGHVAVYGIYFDVDKTDLKPESQKAIAEIAKMLEGSPDLRVLVVGHTDMTGALDHNMELSRGRAASVVASLVGDHGIAADRLVPEGVGPLAPVAPNDTEEGRARNRRVELVELAGTR